MLSKLLPLVFLIAGTGVGVGAAIFLPGGGGRASDNAEEAMTEPAEGAKSEGSSPEGKKPEKTEGDEGSAEFEFVQMTNPFVIPVVEQERVAALVVLSLSLETDYGMKEKVYSLEPKLRDIFLRIMFDHANMGGFSGAFTQTDTLDILREALRDEARGALGEGVKAVLIVDIARQDV